MMNSVADTMGGMGSSMSSVSLLIPILEILGIAALVKYLFSVNNRDDGSRSFLGNRWLFPVVPEIGARIRCLPIAIDLHQGRPGRL